MPSTFSAIDTPSTPLNFIGTWSTGSSNLVTVTSIETETIYPTWIYTISGSGPDSSTTTTVLNLSSSTLNPTQVTVTQTTKLSTTEQETIISSSSSTSTVISESPMSPVILTTSVLSGQMGDLPFSATAKSSDHSWYSDAPSSIWTLPIPLIPSTSASVPLSSSLPVLPETATSSVSHMSSISTPASSIIAATETPTISPSIGTVTSESSSEPSQADNPSPTSSKIGMIVGSIIGGSAVTIFALLACALYMRRRRRKNAAERQGIRQKLIRGDSTSSSISHHRHHSYPSIPGNISLRSPILPFIPLQQQPSNPDLSLDSMYLRGETRAQDPFADPPSTVIEISAPTRSASLYSTSSLGAGVGARGYWDCEREGANALAVPNEYSDTPVMRDSMRSDPFDLDLEPPPSAHHRSSVPSISSTWGVKF
ncbi:hypothetical protein EN45_028870 [Penicillium chrysogenum]|uniref:Uncharacterized protein n=2 Tax=Penicillium chrysogenum species complex TaxID=254878 RepID=B6H2C1_PENRW|nr:uncharacterized protein N7525_003673 [Penicillium rubens]KAJ5838485.1 hypothetical protein N7525_003673 [Penicillium rubens]KAJ5866536.1 hypothetical protein N7534_001089 [Penicillium rubens]KZN92726.1 hypothetical protein EN45_028870 [Penicillium chrysogenum]CAP91556.1 hypothetical protein PCH_Pc13g04870 [Penicillium rubens Wisconsin 54-1255]